MASTVNVYVDPDASGGGTGVDWTNAYTSLQTAQNTEAKDITSSDEIFIFHCRASSGTVDATHVDMGAAGWTTDSTRYIQIQSDEADSHDGEWSDSLYRLAVADEECFDIDSNCKHVNFSRLQLRKTSSSASFQNIFNLHGVNATAVYNIDRCLCRQAGNDSYVEPIISAAHSDITVYVTNCVFYGLSDKVSGSHAHFRIFSATVHASNNTLIGGWDVVDGAAQLTLKNNIMIEWGDTNGLGNGTDPNSNSGYNVHHKDPEYASYGSTHCNAIADDTTASHLLDADGDFVNNGVQVGSVVKNTTDTTYSYVTAVTAGDLTLNDDLFISGEAYTIYTNLIGSPTFKGAPDYHLDSGDTVAQSKGVDLSADTPSVTVDFEGDARADPFDIGADQIVAASGGIIAQSSYLDRRRRN